MGNQVRTLRKSTIRRKKQKKKTERVKSTEAFSRNPVLSTIFEDNENPDSDILDVSEEENNKERTVNGRIPKVSFKMENEDNKQQDPVEPGGTEAPESSETRETLETLETRETPESSETSETSESSETRERMVSTYPVGDEGKSRERRTTLTETDSIVDFITEDNVQQIIDGIIEATNLSDLETGKIKNILLLLLASLQLTPPQPCHLEPLQPVQFCLLIFLFSVDDEEDSEPSGAEIPTVKEEQVAEIGEIFFTEIFFNNFIFPQSQRTAPPFPP